MEAVHEVVAKHPHVRDLLANGWLHLWALDGEGRIAFRYAGDLEWTPVDGTSVAVTPETGTPVVANEARELAA